MDTPDSVPRYVRRLPDETPLSDPLPPAEPAGDGHEKAEAICALAQAMIAAGHADTAAPLVETALKLDPRCAAAYALQGQLLVVGGYVDQAGEALHRALALKPDQDDFYELLTAAKFQSRWRNAAWTALLKALDRTTLPVAEYHRVAEAYLRIHQTDRAITLLQRALQAHPESVYSQEVLARTYVEAHRYREAVAVCQEILRRHPRRLTALELLAEAQLGVGDGGAALDSIRRQLELTPMDATLHLRRGMIAQEAGDFEQALSAYSRVRVLAPDTLLAQTAREGISGIDNYQFQQVVLLASEDRAFRMKLQRDARATLKEYGFHLSPGAQIMVQMMDVDALLQAVQSPTGVTYH